MTKQERIKALAVLGQYISSTDEALEAVIRKSYQHNSWFTPEHIRLALDAIGTAFLDIRALDAWLSNYTLPESPDSKTIAVVAAGNIPMVAFHDILCILVSGHRLQLKLSDKDKYLLPFLLEKLIQLEPRFSAQVQIAEKLEQFDAVIATGSNNTSRHFEYYFGKYPHIIRRNRNSVAILDGSETDSELEALGHDILDYFGMGCRNVSKIFVPQDYDLLQLRKAFTSFGSYMQHTQYMNNLDYQRTIYLMNQIPLTDIDCINIVEQTPLYSPISCLHVERYTDLTQVEKYLNEQAEAIQCIVGKHYLPFGSTQRPGLSDYADGVDTLQFLISLY